MKNSLGFYFVCGLVAFLLLGCPPSETPPGGDGDGSSEGSTDGNTDGNTDGTPDGSTDGDETPLCERDDAEGTSCDDEDPCTENDVCTSGECKGTPMVCNTPPPNECESETQLLTYAAEGTCSAGNCAYTSSRQVCDKGCQNNACIESFTVKNGQLTPAGSQNLSDGTHTSKGVITAGEQGVEMTAGSQKLKIGPAP